MGVYRGSGFFVKIFVLMATLSSAGCSRSIEVPQEKFGLLVRFGEVKLSVVGPAAIDKGAVFESVVYVDKQVEINVLDTRVNYTVTDPVKYFYYFGGRTEDVLRLFEREIKKHPNENATVLIPELVARLDLPIKIVKVELSNE